MNQNYFLKKSALVALTVSCIPLVGAIFSSSVLAASVRYLTWQSVGNLNEPRELHRMISLDNGSILAIGGGSELAGTASATTEIFNTQTNTWSYSALLNTPRRNPEVVKLNNNFLLAIGGSEGTQKVGTNSVELFNGQFWQPVASMNIARTNHAATLLQDGRVLVTGGQTAPGVYQSTAEIYDPNTNTWMLLPNMNEVRSVHHARLLNDGTVLIIGGGTDTSATNTAEIFDPVTGTFTFVGSMNEARWGFLSTILPDGKVLVAGGRIPISTGPTLFDDELIIHSGTEIYDTNTQTWTSVAPMNIPRSMGYPNVNLVTLSDGRIMAAGGRTPPAPYNGVASVEFFDLVTNTWSLGPEMSIGRSYFPIAVPENLVCGGRGPDTLLPLAGCERLVPVPEPSAILGLLALGTLGAASTLKRQLKPSKSTEKATTKVG
jgi:hypothetical protein